jgi:undecaprenyl-diphosphatase
MMVFGRVYIAAHYPLDVAAGLLLGAAVALVGWVMLRRS